MKDVSVCMVTYNQEKFIADSIESVLSQITKFSVKLIIGDDCSTDSTLKICKHYESQYPERIKVFQNDKNLGIVSNTICNFKYICNQGFKYIAMLDGDDYWIDPFKLQKQVDFLERNDNYGYVHTGNGNYYHPSGKKNIEIRKNVPTGDIFDIIWQFPLIVNCTVLFRSDLLQYFDFDAIEKLHLSEIAHLTNVIIASQTKIGFIEDVTAMYRRHENNTTGGRNLAKRYRYIEHEIVQTKYLNTLFPDKIKFSEAYANEYRFNSQLDASFICGNFKEARKIINQHGFLINSDKKFWCKSYFLFQIYPVINLFAKIRRYINNHYFIYLKH